MPNEQTAGDLLFEEFLRTQGGYDFTFEPDWSAELGVEIDTLPDYLVRWDSGLAVCEVKQFETTSLERRLWRQRTITASDREVYGPIREHMRAGARKLRPLRAVGVPLVVVLTNPRGVMVDLDPFVMQHAILGNAAVEVAIHTEGGDSGELPPSRPIARRDGVLLRERRYVSAVVVVHSPDAADVYETGDETAAALPDGAFDDGRGERYGYLSDQRYGHRDLAR